MNAIIIKGLEVQAFVGVSDEERSNPQRLQIDAILKPLTDFSALFDDIALAVDYVVVARRIVRVATERPRQLLETLATEIAEALIGEFRTRSVEVEVRKFILPDTQYVAVRCVRDCPSE
jgi:dihydroneopterin aldolase